MPMKKARTAGKRSYRLGGGNLEVRTRGGPGMSRASSRTNEDTRPALSGVS